MITPSGPGTISVGAIQGGRKETSGDPYQHEPCRLLAWSHRIDRNDFRLMIADLPTILSSSCAAKICRQDPAANGSVGNPSTLTLALT